MKSINWIKHKLLLHVPLWIFAPLAAAVLLFLPDSLSPVALLFVLFAYLLTAYLWRMHLNKKSKPRKRHIGLLGLTFLSFIAAFGIYIALNPHTPQLVIYETFEPQVYDSVDHLSGAKTPRSKYSDRSVTRQQVYKQNIKKGAVSGALVTALNSFNDALFACDYLKQEHVHDMCTGSIDSTKRVELDDDKATVELFIANKDPKECLDSPCLVWLIQTTQVEVDRYIDSTIESSKSGAVQPTVTATMLDQWENVRSPFIISNTLANGWRHVRVTDQSGTDVVWKTPRLVKAP